MEYLGFLVITGLATGFIYSLIALGFVVIYKSTGVLNFAQGAMIMFGAYLCFAFLAQLDITPVIGFLLAFIIASALAFLIERLALRPLIGKSIISLVMITIGLTSIIQGIQAAIWGAEQHSLPQVLPEFSFTFGTVIIPSPYIWASIVSVLLIIAFFVFFKFTDLGIAMKAVSNNQPAALSMGISVRRIFAISWVFSFIIATIGGYLLGSLALLEPALELVVYPLFAAVIIGGLDSIPGALIGGLIIGVLQNLVAGYFGHLTGGAFRTVAPFILLLLVLLIRPYGIFGTPKVERL
jgi:branched-chain amino acid transport system permease protein